MSVAAVMMVRDECDVIVSTIAHLKTQVDAIYVWDQSSTDGTADLLRQQDDIWLRPLAAKGYYQSRYMTQLADQARKDGHDWVLPCDADEIWYSTWGTVAEVLEAHSSDVVAAELYDHVASGADPEETPFTAIGWRRRKPAIMPKVAARALPGLVIEQGNHSVRYPGEHVRQGNGLCVRHFPYRSVEQMVKKVRNGAAAYALTNLPPTIGAHWRQYGDLLEANGESAIEEIFRTWFYVADPESDPTLIYDPAPVC